MLLRWAALMTSLLALFGGLLLSLAFLQWYAVPHLLYRIVSMPRLTQCYLLHPHWGEQGVAGEPGGEPAECIYIPLVYKGTEGQSRSGFLIKEPSGQTSCKQVSNSHTYSNSYCLHT